MVRHGPGQRCKGSPPNGWNDLGEILGEASTEEQCVQACLVRGTCKYVVFKAAGGGKCTSFDTCDELKEASSFSVFAKTSQVLDFATALGNLSAACEPVPAEAPVPDFEELGCRGHDSRCIVLADPTPKNKAACKALRRAGADCFWAKKDPSGQCSGTAWDCSLGWYETEWRCERKGCTWRPSATSPPEPLSVLGPELDQPAAQLADLLNLYSPAIRADADAIAAHLSNTTDCEASVVELRSAFGGFAALLEAVRSSLDPSGQIPELESVVLEPSALAVQVQAFTGAWSPTDLGCMGTDARCPKLGQAACQSVNFDCFWGVKDPKGTCEGNDSRCSGVGEARCKALQSQGARCRWKLSQEFKDESADLEAELSTLTGTAADPQVLLAGSDGRAAALQNALSSLQMSGLPALLAALGMPTEGER